MAISRDEVARIAELARLELDPARLDATAAQLSGVLDFVATLDRLDLSGCEPGETATPAGALRADQVNGRRLGAEIATAGAPAAEAGLFLVPPVVHNLDP